MGVTAATIEKPGHLPQWNTLKIVIGSDTVVGAEQLHHRFPFCAVGPDISQIVHLMNEIMGHFMGNRSRQAILVILGKYPGIVAYFLRTTSHPEHSGTPPLEIKVYRNIGKMAVKQPPGAVNVMPGCGHNFKLL